MDPAVLDNSPLPGPAFPDYTTPPGMCREQFRAMGTTVSVLLPEGSSKAGAVIVRTLFAEWEQTLSRFLPQSELSQLNERAGQRVQVSELLYHVLQTALSAAQATGGVYDPTLLSQLIQAGYDRSFEQVPAVRSGASIYEPAPGGGWRFIQVDASRRAVTIPPDAALDFGGIAKGMAVDAALVRLCKAGIDTALVNAGGDLAVMGLPPGADHWPIEVPGKDGAWTIPLLHGAVATSGIARRQWQQGQERRHHLLDPRSGRPVQNDLWSVTVAAARCEQAEVAAKVAFILGMQQGAIFLRMRQIAGLFVCEDSTWAAVEPWPIHAMEMI